jgi:glucose/mannose-6-phosphate isomerase
MAVFYNFAALVQLFDKTGLIGSDKYAELRAAAEWLSTQQADFLPTVPTDKNPAKKLALELMGKSPVIYAGPKLFPAAYKWKINFNENAKNVAWCNQIPEFNHNEFLGWTSHPIDKPYAVVDLRSSREHERVQKRFEVTERLLSGKRPSPHVVEAQGESVLQQLLWTITLGDFVSLYLALLNGLNPTPVDLIEKFKKSLDS